MAASRLPLLLLGCAFALISASEWIAALSQGLSPAVRLVLLLGVAVASAAMLTLLAMRLLASPAGDSEADGLRAQVLAERTARSEALRRMRHDVRGALSPALLMSDRLVAHAEPGVRRAGEITVLSVQKAVELLAEPKTPDSAT